MPSVYSISSLRVLLSSTVMTPSLPTFSIASANSLPISASLAEMAAIRSRSSRPLTGTAMRLISATAASVARSMPRLISIGLAPAVTLRRPSVTIAWARMVAVVVPSPATSFVLVAACFNIWAPMFWNGSSSSISLATVTPSWVTVGGPHFLSMATLRPRGPRVTLTAFARASIPLLSCRRADSSNKTSLAVMVHISLGVRPFVTDLNIGLQTRPCWRAQVQAAWRSTGRSIRAWVHSCRCSVFRPGETLMLAIER